MASIPEVLIAGTLKQVLIVEQWSTENNSLHMIERDQGNHRVFVYHHSFLIRRS
tara:strand:- start:163 stop:324 length:162 start_codon:yes stop_codon:yes gene_type:complete